MSETADPGSQQHQDRDDECKKEQQQCESSPLALEEAFNEPEAQPEINKEQLKKDSETLKKKPSKPSYANVATMTSESSKKNNDDQVVRLSELCRDYKAKLLDCKSEIESLKDYCDILKGELGRSAKEKDMLLATVSQMESKLFGEGDETHHNLDSILNSYRRLHSYFLDDLVTEITETHNKTFTQACIFAHWILKEAFKSAQSVKMGLTVPSLIVDEVVGKQVSQVVERVMLKRSSQKLLDQWKVKLSQDLKEAISIECRNEESLANVWNARFADDCVDVAWKCQWHNINENLQWRLLFPDCAENKKVFESLGTLKTFQVSRNNLTDDDLQDISQSTHQEGAAAESYFLVWPMLCALENNATQVKKAHAFFQIVLPN
eukprot:TRINITY_DN7745_c0_g1_i1.p1 TRINITY_DN7745_c0_g1~~TRINITY_DN7745_c0_g1_i1.p1  ORF type:complete len:378 (+),score=103.77 TRINITY_DN7745_c0_g1_i1:77-1210(+)